MLVSDITSITMPVPRLGRKIGTQKLVRSECVFLPLTKRQKFCCGGLLFAGAAWCVKHYATVPAGVSCCERILEANQTNVGCAQQETIVEEADGNVFFQKLLNMYKNVSEQYTYETRNYCFDIEQELKKINEGLKLKVNDWAIPVKSSYLVKYDSSSSSVHTPVFMCCKSQPLEQQMAFSLKESGESLSKSAEFHLWHKIDDNYYHEKSDQVVVFKQHQTTLHVILNNIVPQAKISFSTVPADGFPCKIVNGRDVCTKFYSQKLRDGSYESFTGGSLSEEMRALQRAYASGKTVYIPFCARAELSSSNDQIIIKMVPDHFSSPKCHEGIEILRITFRKEAELVRS